ncbi:mannose-binding protein a [Plakobranchus ocellatus]|uniref:Mannose-binding protein a n=1 Tax=Plakobranchus ocellatus TaxID=259542 RepID=A0AAV4AIE8_9GAST|nr:mannose-binding protein a [Plakobranchus ocellatus]
MVAHMHYMVVFVNSKIRYANKAVRVNVIKPKIVNPDSPSLEVKCTFDRSRTNIVTVSELEIVRFDIGGGGKREMVAEITSANLTYGLSQSEISASGKIQNDATSDLVISYTSNTDGYCQLYSCMAKGIQANGQEVSIYRPLKVRGVNGSLCKSKHPVKVPASGNEECCVSSEALQAQNQSIESLEVEVQKCSAVIPEVTNNGIEIEELRERMSNLSKELHQVKQENQGFMNIFSVNRNEFDVSSLFNGRVYAVRKQKAVFRLEVMNLICKSLGGYVVEFDGKEEQKFVTFFLKSVGIYIHYLGATDEESEGNFVYLTSQKPVENVVWTTDRPISKGPSKNCIVITLTGLANVVCNEPSRIVCEIPVMGSTQSH